MASRTKTVKWGSSHAVRIPKAVLRQAALREGIELKMSVESGRIWLEPSNPFDLQVARMQIPRAAPPWTRYSTRQRRIWEGHLCKRRNARFRPAWSLWMRQKGAGLYLQTRPLPHFELRPHKPGLLVRIDADGKRTLGRFVGRKFRETKEHSPK